MDVVVTVPRRDWEPWLREGDQAGHPWTGRESFFYVPTRPTRLDFGDRVYVVAHGRLRGYAPLIRIEEYEGRYALVRRGEAVAVTIPQSIQGFRGFRYRWWSRDLEWPFPKWQTP